MKLDLEKWVKPKIFKNFLIDHLGRFSPRFFKGDKEVWIHTRQEGCTIVFKEKRQSSIDKNRFYSVFLCLTHGVECFHSGVECSNTTLLEDRK